MIRTWGVNRREEKYEQVLVDKSKGRRFLKYVRVGWKIC
jgi:hypothetical protein